MTNKQHNKHHLWIPNQEVEFIDNIKQGRDKPRDVVYSAHGEKLSTNLKLIISHYEKNHAASSISHEDLVIFKVNLPDGEKLDNAQRQKILSDNGLEINVVKNKKSAIVSTTKAKFSRLQNRINKYKATGALADFQYLDNFEPLLVNDKETTSIKRIIHTTANKDLDFIDLQFLLLPHLSSETYIRALPKLVELINLNGDILREPYFLSDGTPVIRAFIKVSAIDIVANDEAVYRVEQTHFFQPEVGSKNNNCTQFNISTDINLDLLPTVAVLDSGINLPNNMMHLVIERWSPINNYRSTEHGTEVASKAIFSNLGIQCNLGGSLIPRAKVIDIPIFDQDDNKNSELDMVERIQLTVEKYKNKCKIYNLSLNSTEPIDGDEISIMGYELDTLMQKHGVQFVISAGNHSVYNSATSLDDILDDDDCRIAAPADSMLGITVGSIVGHDHDGSISKKNDVAPYSRIGPGFAGYHKPDLVTYAGTIANINGSYSVPSDNFATVISSNGNFEANAGTSFSAPMISGDLAEIYDALLIKDMLLAKTLLFHSSQHIIDTESCSPEDLAFISNLYGRGVPNLISSNFSSNSKVTFIRTGTLCKSTKERVKFYMPTLLAAQVGRNVAKVTVTCISNPPFNRAKGEAYLCAYINASLHKYKSNSASMPVVNPSGSRGRTKWDVCFHFNRLFSSFDSGDWQLWLDLSTRWDVPDNYEVPYALAITIEDISGSLDLYSSVLQEAKGRFIPMNELPINNPRVKVR